MRKIFLFGWVMTLAYLAEAQSAEDWNLLYPTRSADSGNTQPEKPYQPSPEEITSRADAYIDSVAQVDLKSNRIQGYRILIYSGNDREASNRSRESAYRVFSNADLYTVYKSPTFKVSLGNFHSRLEAYFAWKKLLTSLPGAVIVPEVVLLKP